MAGLTYSETEYQEAMDRMAREAARELQKMAHPSAAERGRRLARRALRRSVGSSDPIFWPAGLLMLGLVEAGHYTEAEEYLAPWISGGMPVQNPDDAITGVVLLRLYQETGRDCYRQAADRILQYLQASRRDAEGAVVYGQRSGNDWIYADGTGQVSMFLSACGHSDEALQQLLLFASHGIDERSGLPYHGYDAASGLCHGIIGWGRAVGWLMLGIASYTVDTMTPKGEDRLPESDREGIRSESRRNGEDRRLQGCGEDGPLRQLQLLLTAMRERRRKDGLFSWQLDCRKGPLDTSASGMIYYALQCMEEQAAPFTQDDLDLAANALLSQVDERGRVLQASAECIDFAQYVQRYGCYPWGQGAVLAFLAVWGRHRIGKTSGR